MLSITGTLTNQGSHSGIITNFEHYPCGWCYADQRAGIQQNTEQYYEGHPYLTEDASLFLNKNSAKLVGVDMGVAE